MELVEMFKLQLAALLIGVPAAVLIGAIVAAITTPLPERGKKKP